MQILSDKSVVIETFQELEKVLTEDNSYTYIYFNDDITL